MIEQKRFSGVLNVDDALTDVLPFQHIHGRNVRFTGGGNGLTCFNIKGNFLIPNSDLPSGSNECIGAFFDQVNQRIIWFNYNSNDLHGIYQLLVQTGVVSTIFRVGENSATDILRFSLDYPITSASIVYRTAGEGDLLYWTDGNVGDENRPRYLNLATVSALSPFTEDMINAAKNAPATPPTVEYQSDTNINVNNLTKKLFQFAYAWGYQQASEKSTISGWSKTPLPSNGYDPNTQNDPTQNNNIAVTVIGGGDDYDKIYLYARECIGTQYSDPFLIDVLDASDYNISPGASYIYYFYNNSVYPVDAGTYPQLKFDWLPNYATALELLNGNVIIYANTTDGYDRLTRSQTNVTITSGLVSGGSSATPLITNSYNGLDKIIITIGSTVIAGLTYHVEFDYGSNPPGPTSSKNVNYVTTGADTQNSVVNGLIALIQSVDVNCVNNGAGVLEITLNVAPIAVAANIVTTVAGFVGSTTASSSWKWRGRYRFGLVYFDDRNKTNGVISYLGTDADTTDFGVTTPAFNNSGATVQVPVINATIDHTPPTWATTYQWVRTNNITTDNFLMYITNDYQDPGDGYLYFCIQNLLYQKTQETGFVPSYEFSPGDRMVAIAKYNSGTGQYTTYNVQLDFEIVGTVQRTMTNPATSGLFIKVVKPSTLPSLAYSTFNLIELYTPALRNDDETQVFYEWGEKYDIYESGGNRFHRGQTADQTAVQPATFQWFDGDVYFKNRRWYTTVSSVATAAAFMMDRNYSDYFSSAVNSNGRDWVIDENQKTITNSVQLRWGQKYQQDTDVNDLNRFYPNDATVIDLSKGAIQRLKSRDRILRIFQDRGVGQMGVYARFIQNNEGNTELVTTNEIITTNNINYYQGTYGLCGYRTNLVSTPNQDYFTDVVTGRGIRLSGDGITDLGMLYKGQYFFPDWVRPYNQEILRSNGAIAKVMGYFDDFENEYHTMLQAGTLLGTSYANRHFSFNEPRNGYCADEYDFHPDWALSVNGITYTWKDGALYKHDVSGNNYCTFYGQLFDAEITVVFNSNVERKKSWHSISEVANTIWDAPVIQSNVMSYGTTAQTTNLVAAEFALLESMPSASIKRDVNSNGGKINGAFIKGNTLSVKLRKQNASSLVSLSEIYVRLTDSPLTPN